MTRWSCIALAASNASCRNRFWLPRSSSAAPAKSPPWLTPFAASRKSAMESGIISPSLRSCTLAPSSRPKSKPRNWPRNGQTHVATHMHRRDAGGKRPWKPKPTSSRCRCSMAKSDWQPICMPMIGRLGFGEMRVKLGDKVTRYYLDGEFGAGIGEHRFGIDEPSDSGSPGRQTGNAVAAGQGTGIADLDFRAGRDSRSRVGPGPRPIVGISPAREPRPARGRGGACGSPPACRSF